MAGTQGLGARRPRRCNMPTAHAVLTTSRQTPPRHISLPAAILVAAWFLLALGLGAAGVFESPPTRPPLAIFLAFVGPPVVFAIAYRASRTVQATVLGIDLRLLTAMQAWRVLGGMFLALYAFGLLPGAFAWPAGVGDVAVGLAAPFVVLAVARGVPTWR